MFRILSALTLILLTILPSHATEALWVENEATVETPTGTLHGSFIRPMGESFDVVLIIAGSGPTDRNGNGPLVATDAYGMVARALGEALLEVITHRPKYVRPRAPIAAQFSPDTTAAHYEALFERLMRRLASGVRRQKGDERGAKGEKQGGDVEA